MPDIDWRKAAEQLRRGAHLVREHGWTEGVMIAKAARHA